MLNSTESYGNSGNMKIRVDHQSIFKTRRQTSAWQHPRKSTTEETFQSRNTCHTMAY